MGAGVAIIWGSDDKRGELPPRYPVDILHPDLLPRTPVAPSNKVEVWLLLRPSVEITASL